VLVLVGALLTGCGTAAPQPRTVVGPVTVVSHDSVCVGGPAASGECFVQDRTTRRLHVGECLRVTYTPDGTAAYQAAARIEHLDAARHGVGCPPPVRTP
jgi:hypothetical protein